MFSRKYFQEITLSVIVLIFSLLILFFFLIPVHGLYRSAAVNEVTGFWHENPSYKVREKNRMDFLVLWFKVIIVSPCRNFMQAFKVTMGFYSNGWKVKHSPVTLDEWLYPIM